MLTKWKKNEGGTRHENPHCFEPLQIHSKLFIPMLKIGDDSTKDCKCDKNLEQTCKLSNDMTNENNCVEQLQVVNLR